MSAATAKAQDPSMEEILASIRRIIADDQDSPKPTAGSEPEVPEEDGDVLDLAELAPSPPPASPPMPSPPASDALDVELPDLSFQAARDAQPVPALPIAAPLEPAGPRTASIVAQPQDAPDPQPGARPDLSLASATASSVSQAFNLLSQTVLARNNHTVEDLVKEMLRPMLKAWLDDNLPPLVERLVRTEIERVARGRS